MEPVCLALLAVVTFWSGLSGNFVLDDKFAVLRNAVVQGSAPLIEVFGRNFWGDPLDQVPYSFRPLTTLSYVLDRAVLGGSALAFHLSSLAWYIALVLAAWAFARRCLGAAGACLALVLFVVMPVHVENVSAVAGRADTLGLLFGVLACLALSPTLVEGKAASVHRLVVAAAAFAAAMLSKESMAVLPVVIALLAEHRRRAVPGLSLGRAHLPSIVVTVVLAIYLVCRLHIQPQMLSQAEPDNVLAGAKLWERLGYTLEVLGRYAKLVVLPFGLGSGRRFAEVYRPTHVSLLMLFGASICALAVYVSRRDHRQGRFPFVPAAFFAWLLISGLFFEMPESMADRYLLQPSLFLCLAVGPALVALWKKGRTWQTAIVAIIGAQAILSARQARTWHDERTLLAHAVQVCPNSLQNHFHYAEYLSEHGETAEAVWHYGVVTAGRHAFPYAWTHPAQEAEATLPVDARLRQMHRLLGFTIDEATWRLRFAAYLRSFGRRREADLVTSIQP
jgi:hypothetical protein